MGNFLRQLLSPFYQSFENIVSLMKIA